jgi:4'-phosphopantetheinyl transferase
MSEDAVALRFPSPTGDEIPPREPGMVDLWCYFPESSHDPELLSAQAALMTPDEHERCGRFHFERERRLFIATRALARTVLSSYFPVAPGDWRFSNAEHGKPFIASPILRPRLQFNLAHTQGLVVCVVSATHELIGVDAEMIESGRDIFRDAERYFSLSERGKLRACPTPKRPRLFLAYWTLKESFAKARGEGLSLPLDGSSFHFEEDAIHIVLDPSLAEDATSWRFALLDASPHHIIAVAVKTSGAPLTLRITHIVPLGKAVEGAQLAAISRADLLK